MRMGYRPIATGFAVILLSPTGSLHASDDALLQGRAVEVVRSVLTLDSKQVISYFKEPRVSIESANTFSDALHAQYGRLIDVSGASLGLRLYGVTEVALRCPGNERYTLKFWIGADNELVDFTGYRQRPPAVDAGNVKKSRIGGITGIPADLYDRETTSLSRAETESAKRFVKNYIQDALGRPSSYEFQFRYPPPADRAPISRLLSTTCSDFSILTIDRRTELHRTATVEAQYQYNAILVDVIFGRPEDGPAVASLVAVPRSVESRYEQLRVEREEQRFAMDVRSAAPKVTAARETLKPLSIDKSQYYFESDVRSAFEASTNALKQAVGRDDTTAQLRIATITSAAKGLIPPAVSATVEGRTVRVITTSAVDRSLQSLQRYSAMSSRNTDYTPDLYITSDPPGATFSITVAEDLKTQRTTRTNNILANVWLGIYQGKILRDGYKAGVFELDLLDDPRPLVLCTLAKVNADDKSNCQQVSQ